MNLSPLGRSKKDRRKTPNGILDRQKTEKQPRATSSDYYAEKTPVSNQKKSEASFSRTDNQSQRSREELKSHKYEEENVISGPIFNSGVKDPKI